MKVLDAVSTGATLLKAKLSGAAVPFHVAIYPTTHCNLRCVYCSSPYQQVRELRTAEWQRVLDELRALKGRRLGVLGGEPLVREDLGTIIGHARAIGFRVALTSNGTLVPQKPGVIKQLDTLIISLDGNEEAHDRSRGKGSHAHAMAAIQAARSWGVPVKINAVLTPYSGPSLPWLFDLARRERLPLTINVMRSEENGLWHDAAAHRQSRDAIRQLVDAIVEAKKENRWIVFSAESYRLTGAWPDFTRDRLTAREVGGAFAGPRCSAGRFHCAIYADGSLYPCSTTIRQVPALNVTTAGVAAALARARQHGCVTCFTPCMLEENGLFALRPAVVANLARTYLTTSFE